MNVTNIKVVECVRQQNIVQRSQIHRFTIHHSIIISIYFYFNFFKKITYVQTMAHLDLFSQHPFFRFFLKILTNKIFSLSLLYQFDSFDHETRRNVSLELNRKKKIKNNN